MAISSEILRIQSFLRESVRRSSEWVALPPFTLFFHKTDAFKYFNYAIPDETMGAAPADPAFTQALKRLRAEFKARGRTPRFEFFEAFAPALPAALQQHGFVEEARQWSMLCSPATFQAVPEVPGLAVSELTASSPDADLLDFVLAQHEGFAEEDADADKTASEAEPEPGERQVAELRHNLQINRFHAFLGRIDGQAAGVSVFSHPLNGVCEIAGVATRPAYRRRGIAGYLTWLAVRRAFEMGVVTACLTAADANAGRVYERIGFQPFSTMLAYIDSAA